MQQLPLLNTSKQSKRFLFEIHSLQWIRENGLYDMETIHSNNFFEIVWITGGAGIHWMDLEKQTIEPGKLFFIQPGQVHRLQSGNTAEGFVISFAEDFLNPEDILAGSACYKSLFRFFAQQPASSPGNKWQTDLLDVVTRMMKEYNNADTFGFELLKRYFKIFMIYLSRQYESSLGDITQSRNTELVKKFMDLLEKKYKDKKMVADYARELTVTPNYLNEIVKKLTGAPAGQHIRKRIVLEAKRLGLYSDYCMKEIAYQLGFADSAHFSKFFKSVTGENFSDFKKVKLTFSIAV